MTQMHGNFKVSQIRSRSEQGYAFLNFDDEPGRVGVWGSSYAGLTYLWQLRDEFHLVCFENQGFADEWLMDGHADAQLVKWVRP